jgi:hypothetical protein
MTTKKVELEVDFIGGLGPLTAEEEKAISEFIKTQKKSSKHLPLSRKHPLQKKSKSVV